MPKKVKPRIIASRRASRQPAPIFVLFGDFGRLLGEYCASSLITLVEVEGSELLMVAAIDHKGLDRGQQLPMRRAALWCGGPFLHLGRPRRTAGQNAMWVTCAARPATRNRRAGGATIRI